MLKKSARLTKKQFDTFFKQGRRFHSPHLQLVFTPHEEFHGAAVVGKKVAKKATHRNRLRRRLYAALYDLHTAHDLTGIYIMLAKPALKDASYAELKTTLSNLVDSR